MDKKLTDKQRNVIDAIKYYISIYGFSPTVRELGSMLNIKSTSTIHGYLERLERLGCITRENGSPRTLRVISISIDAIGDNEYAANKKFNSYMHQNV